MKDKKELIKEVILKNPNLSGNEIYEITKKKGIGIRKTDFYGLVREVRDLPEPTIEKREKSIPIKHRIIKPKVIKVKFPKKEGQYGIVEIDGIDIDGNPITKWIKYTDKKDYNDQLAFVKEKYQIVKMNIIFHGFNKYAEFVEKEFKEQLALEGISI